MVLWLGCIPLPRFKNSTWRFIRVPDEEVQMRFHVVCSTTSTMLSMSLLPMLWLRFRSISLWAINIQWARSIRVPQMQNRHMEFLHTMTVFIEVNTWISCYFLFMVRTAIPWKPVNFNMWAMPTHLRLKRLGKHGVLMYRISCQASGATSEFINFQRKPLDC